MILISPQHRGDTVDWIKSLKQKSTFYPYVTHSQVPAPLVPDALQLSIYFLDLASNLHTKPTS